MLRVRGGGKYLLLPPSVRHFLLTRLKECEKHQNIKIRAKKVQKNVHHHFCDAT